MLQLERVRKKSTTRNKRARRFRRMEYTIREAAELRGVHPTTVRRQIKRGEINARIKYVPTLRTVIYYIPQRQLSKIQARPGRRTDLAKG